MIPETWSGVLLWDRLLLLSLCGSWPHPELPLVPSNSCHQYMQMALGYNFLGKKRDFAERLVAVWGGGCCTWGCQRQPELGTPLSALPLTPAQLCHFSVTSQPCQTQQEFCLSLHWSQDVALFLRL